MRSRGFVAVLAIIPATPPHTILRVRSAASWAAFRARPTGPPAAEASALLAAPGAADRSVMGRGAGGGGGGAAGREGEGGELPWRGGKIWWNELWTLHRKGR